MTVRVHKSERSRHLVIGITDGEILPGALAARLALEHVACGWLRASGVLVDVELQAFDARLGRLGGARRIAGVTHVLAVESSIGLTDGVPSFSLRAVLARETDRGFETLAGEIVAARAVAFEVLVTALDDLSLRRPVDDTGVALLAAASSANEGPATTERGLEASPAPPPAVPPMRSASSLPPPGRPGGAGGWSNAVEASAMTDREPSAGTRALAATLPIPQRPARPELDLDTPAPEPGDVVDHFAFGRCDVLKSDGDRLHLRGHKDGRIREIALDMLRVTRLEPQGGGAPGRHFKLERRL